MLQAPSAGILPPCLSWIKYMAFGSKLFLDLSYFLISFFRFKPRHQIIPACKKEIKKKIKRDGKARGISKITVGFFFQAREGDSFFFAQGALHQSYTAVSAALFESNTDEQVLPSARYHGFVSRYF